MFAFDDYDIHTHTHTRTFSIHIRALFCNSNDNSDDTKFLWTVLSNTLIPKQSFQKYINSWTFLYMGSYNFSQCLLQCLYHLCEWFALFRLGIAKLLIILRNHQCMDKSINFVFFEYKKTYLWMCVRSWWVRECAKILWNIQRYLVQRTNPHSLVWMFDLIYVSIGPYRLIINDDKVF